MIQSSIADTTYPPTGLYAELSGSSRCEPRTFSREPDKVFLHSPPNHLTPLAPDRLRVGPLQTNRYAMSPVFYIQIEICNVTQNGHELKNLCHPQQVRYAGCGRSVRLNQRDARLQITNCTRDELTQRSAFCFKSCGGSSSPARSITRAAV